VPRAEREERTPRGEGRAEPRGEGRGDSRRGPRPERAPKAEETAAAPQAFVDTDQGAEAGAGEGDREGRGRRRRRGGRERGEGRGDEAAVVAEGTSLPEATVATPDDSAPTLQVAEAPAAAEGAPETGERGPRGRRRGGRGRDRAREDGEAAVAAEAVPAEAPVAEAWAPAAAPAAASDETVTAAAEWQATPAPEPTPAAAAMVEPPQAGEPIRIEPYRLPTDELRLLASSAGLEWVLSDADKIRIVQEAMAAEPPPVRQPREPRHQVLVDDGPLVLVETRKDLSQLKLPFEASAG